MRSIVTDALDESPRSSGGIRFFVSAGTRAGRTHIQVEVSANGRSVKVTQIAFPGAVNAEVYRGGVYAARGQNPTSNAGDTVVRRQPVVRACDRQRQSHRRICRRVHGGYRDLGSRYGSGYREAHKNGQPSKPRRSRTSRRSRHFLKEFFVPFEFFVSFVV